MEQQLITVTIHRQESPEERRRREAAKRRMVFLWYVAAVLLLLALCWWTTQQKRIAAAEQAQGVVKFSKGILFFLFAPPIDALYNPSSQGMQKGDRTHIYYCHPYSAYERGSNENVNRMIRRWFPKGTNFNRITAEEVSAVERWINSYPRGILGNHSAGWVFRQLAPGAGLEGVKICA